MKHILKLVYRFVMVIGCGWGLVLTFGLDKGMFNPAMLVYYTLQSNLVIVVAYGFLIIRSLMQSIRSHKVEAVDYSPNIMGALTIMIVVTGLIFNFILAHQSGSGGLSAGSLSNFLVHTFTPLAVFADWLVFVPKRRLSRLAPFYWIVIPMLYWAFAIVRAQIGGPLANGSYYPYPFIDFDKFGIGYVLRYVAVLVVFFVILGYLMLGLNALIIKLQRQDTSSRKAQE